MHGAGIVDSHSATVGTDSARLYGITTRRFLASAGLIGVMSMQFEVLLFAAPLWIAKLGHAPRWTVSAVLVINTVLVATLQVRRAGVWTRSPRQ